MIALAWFYVAKSRWIMQGQLLVGRSNGTMSRCPTRERDEECNDVNITIIHITADYSNSSSGITAGNTRRHTLPAERVVAA